jgi:hypothetical protein
MTLTDLVRRQLLYMTHYDMDFDAYHDAFERELATAPQVEPHRVFDAVTPFVVLVDHDGFGYTESPKRKIHHRPFHALFAWADEERFHVELIDLERRLIRIGRLT